MIDIHSHILPKVDDGAEDMEMSIEMARIYLKNGIKKVIATPHYIEGSNATSLENNKLILQEFREKLEDEGLEIEVFLGNEVFIFMDIIEHIEKGSLGTLNDSRYILIELPMFDIPLYVENIIYELLLRDYIPIIAHPERNSKIIEDPNILYNYINKGALTQLNLPSLEGKYGEKVKNSAEILLRHNMIHFVGTDAHKDRRRSPRVKNALDILKFFVSKEDFENLTYKNADSILSNKAIEINSPIIYRGKRGILNLFRKKTKHYD